MTVTARPTPETVARIPRCPLSGAGIGPRLPGVMSVPHPYKPARAATRSLGRPA